MTKILEKVCIKSYYVRTELNATDIGSRGNLLSKIAGIWWKAPSWIAENNKWPDQPILSESKECEKEAKIIKGVSATAFKQKYLFDLLLEIQKVLMVSTWITRFINNCRKIKTRGSLTISEIQCQNKC